LSEDAEKSAKPSKMPSRALDPPAMVVKNIANTEKTISELRSVRKLTKPSLSTSGWTANRFLHGSGIHFSSDGVLAAS
jgi:hypothetical protein